MTNNLKKMFYFLHRRIYIPDEIKKINTNTLLHISDTPSTIYKSINMLIKEINPKYVIHTGDLVDDIKLEIYPSYIYHYEKKVKTLLEILEDSKAKQIFISLGNHDDKKLVNKHSKRINIIDVSDDININNIEIKISHFPEEINKNPKEYNLFGHDVTLKSGVRNSRIYLNGISNIHIIDLDSKKIFKLRYPLGTNDSRLCKSKIGF